MMCVLVFTHLSVCVFYNHIFVLLTQCAKRTKGSIIAFIFELVAYNSSIEAVLSKY
jgi:hypothetical protein